jgi:cell wall-associated NlpC family hydrolase
MIKNYGICQVSIAPVRATASDESEIVTQLLFGDYVQVLEKDQPWIKIYFPNDNYTGYMDFKQLMYISDDEFKTDSIKNHEVLKEGVLQIDGPLGKQAIICGSSLPNYENGKISFAENTYQVGILPAYTLDFVESAKRYLNTPYLWGGKGIYGIDCSGFTQIVAKLHGIALPRDASKQVSIGLSIDYSERQIGDIMYFINKKNSVHHVGILVNENAIIHAAGHVRIDDFDEKGIFRQDLNKYTHFYHSIKRL